MMGIRVTLGHSVVAWWLEAPMNWGSTPTQCWGWLLGLLLLSQGSLSLLALDRDFSSLWIFLATF